VGVPVTKAGSYSHLCGEYSWTLWLLVRHGIKLILTLLFTALTIMLLNHEVQWTN